MCVIVSGPDFSADAPLSSAPAQNGPILPESPFTGGDHTAPPLSHPHTHIPPSSYSYDMPAAISPRPVEPLEIILSTDKLVCRGVSANLDPVLLSGHVVLNLSEATNIREISLDLVGKARFPHGETRTSQTMINPVLFMHHWSLLPGDSHRKHTIKEGRHVFPFQLELSGSLPASMICAHACASVYYKLRATAVRSAFSTNFHTVKPFWFIKGLSPEAMEYSQTLEIENTWSGKIMYSIMIPHKAFAAGDTIPVLIRMSPLSKGVSVLSIAVDIKEFAVTKWKRHSDSSSAILQSETFDVVDGKAVLLSGRGPPGGVASQTASLTASGSSGPADTSASRFPSTPLARSTSLINLIGLGGLLSPEGASSSTPRQEAAIGSLFVPSTRPTLRAFNAATMFEPSSASSPSIDMPPLSRRPSHEQDSTIRESGTSLSASVTDPAASTLLNGDSDVDTTFSIFIPYSATPSHQSPSASDASSVPSPLSITHKIQFNVALSNLDGHTSELRCSLPIHILSPHLLREVRAATRVTRNILFGSSNEVHQHDVGDDQPDVVLAELPSYNSHVRDRVANAEMVVDGGHGRTLVTSNPLLLSSTPGSPSGNGWTVMHSPGGNAGHFPLTHGVGGDSAPRSGRSTPHDGTGTPLHGDGRGIRQDWNPIEFDQELMLSLGQIIRSNESSIHSNSLSAGPSRGGSRAVSRVQSRAPSPEPGEQNNHHHDNEGGPHPSGNGAGLRGGFHLPNFKALSALSTLRGSTRSQIPSAATSSSAGSLSRPSSCSLGPPNSSASIIPPPPAENDATYVASAEEFNPLSRVPSYSISSRGFLGGGVTPLQLYRDLPSYDQAEATSRISRTQSEASLAFMRREFANREPRR